MSTDRWLMACDHKFVDSNICLKCGWAQGAYEPRSVYELEDAPRATRQEERRMNLPDIEVVSAKAHEAWMAAKRAQGVTTRRSETGEELMVPYEALSDAAKDLDRGAVKAVYAAIAAAQVPA